MYLYLYQDGEKRQGGSNQSISDRSELLVWESLKDYLERTHTDPDCHRIKPVFAETENIKICRTEKGKPFFSSEKEPELPHPIRYSVSHSGEWWGCLMSDEEVGFDLEVHRERVNYEKIAKRFFTEEEYVYVQKNGAEAFFELWVRKEAFVKYLGAGLSFGLSRFSVLEGDQPAGRITLREGNLTEGEEKTTESGEQRDNKHMTCGKGISCFVSLFEIQKNVSAAYCSGSGEKIKKRVFLNNPYGKTILD